LGVIELLLKKKKDDDKIFSSLIPQKQIKLIYIDIFIKKFEALRLPFASKLRNK
jgi:hypothetical protein